MSAGYFPRRKCSLQSELGWYLKRADVKVQSWPHVWRIWIFLCKYLQLPLSLNFRCGCNSVAESAGENLSEACIWKKMQLMSKIHCSLCVCRICLCDERWSSHQRLCCGSLTASSWWLGRPLFHSLSQSPPSIFTSCPRAHPQEVGSLTKAPVGVTWWGE